MRTEFLTIITLIKVLIILVGLGFTFWIVIKGLMKKEVDWKTKALKYFFWTAGLTILLSLLDFLMAYQLAS